MGSMGNLAKKVRKNFADRMQEKYRLSPGMVHKLFAARDKALLKVLDEHGVSIIGLRDSENRIDQSSLRRRMELVGVQIKIVDAHNDPRENGIVVFKHGKAVVAISQPYIRKGDIHVDIVEPSMLISGVA